MLRLTVLCLLVAVVSSETNPGPREFLCQQCKNVENTIEQAIESAITQAQGIGDTSKSTCESLPEMVKSPCLTFLETYDRQLDTATEFLENLAVCQSVYRCKEEFRSMNLEENDGLGCSLCKLTVEAVLSAVSLDDLLDKGGERLVEICAQLEIVAKDDCATSIEQLKKQLEMPSADMICESINLCSPSWFAAT